MTKNTGITTLCASDTGQKTSKLNIYTISAFSFVENSGLLGNTRVLKASYSTGAEICAASMALEAAYSKKDPINH